MKKLFALFLALLTLTCAGAYAAEKVDKASVTFPSSYYAMHADAYLPYEAAYSEGLAPVCIDGKIGFINTSGVLVIPAVWENAEPFLNGLSLVKGEYGYGFINTRGQTVIAPIWTEFEFPTGCQGDPTGYFYNGITWVRDHDGFWGLINNRGKVLLSPQLPTRGDRSLEWTSPTFGAGDKGVTIAFDYDSYTFHAINGKGAACGLYSRLIALDCFNVETYAAGYSRHNVFAVGDDLFLADGTPVTPAQVEEDPGLILPVRAGSPDTSSPIGQWQDPLPVLPGGKVFAAVKEGLPGRTLIDASGTPLCADTFDPIEGFHLIDNEYLLAFSLQGGSYRVEADGTVSQADHFSIPIMGGLLTYDHEKGLCKDGKPIPGQDRNVSYVGYVNNRLLLLYSEEKEAYGLVSSRGEMISNPHWDMVSAFDESTVLVLKDGLYGLLDTFGKTVLQPDYDEVVAVSQGIALARKDGLYTFHDVTTGKLLGGRGWSYAEPFSSNRAYVWWEDDGAQQEGFINTNGQVVFTLPDDIYSVRDYVYRDDMLLCENGGIFFLDRGGKLAVKGPWDDATHFSGDRAIAWKDGEWFIINRQGAVVY